MFDAVIIFRQKNEHFPEKTIIQEEIQNRTVLQIIIAKRKMRKRKIK